MGRSWRSRTRESPPKARAPCPPRCAAGSASAQTPCSSEKGVEPRRQPTSVASFLGEPAPSLPRHTLPARPEAKDLKRLRAGRTARDDALLAEMREEAPDTRDDLAATTTRRAWTRAGRAVLRERLHGLLVDRQLLGRVLPIQSTSCFSIMAAHVPQQSAGRFIFTVPAMSVSEGRAAGPVWSGSTDLRSPPYISWAAGCRPANRSAMAAMVRLGLTPILAGTLEPSITNSPG